MSGSLSPGDFFLCSKHPNTKKAFLPTKSREKKASYSGIQVLSTPFHKVLALVAGHKWNV